MLDGLRCVTLRSLPPAGRISIVCAIRLIGKIGRLIANHADHASLTIWSSGLARIAPHSCDGKISTSQTGAGPEFRTWVFKILKRNFFDSLNIVFGMFN